MSAEQLQDYNYPSTEDENSGYHQLSAWERVRNWVRRNIWGEPNDEEMALVAPTEAPQTAASVIPTSVLRQPVSSAPTRIDTLQDRQTPLEIHKPSPVKELNVVQTISDERHVRAAADALKNGEQVLLSLDGFNQMAAEEVINFLCGVCYAGNGNSMKVNDKTFMFTPSGVNLTVDFADKFAEEKSAQPRKSHFDQRTGTV